MQNNNNNINNWLRTRTFPFKVVTESTLCQLPVQKNNNKINNWLRTHTIPYDDVTESTTYKVVTEIIVSCEKVIDIGSTFSNVFCFNERDSWKKVIDIESIFSKDDFIEYNNNNKNDCSRVSCKKIIDIGITFSNVFCFNERVSLKKVIDIGNTFSNDDVIENDNNNNNNNCFRHCYIRTNI